jgi:hypothetical protein
MIFALQRRMEKKKKAAQLVVRMESPMMARLRQEAARKDTTVSAIIVALVRKWMGKANG